MYNVTGQDAILKTGRDATLEWSMQAPSSIEATIMMSLPSPRALPEAEERLHEPPSAETAGQDRHSGEAPQECKCTAHDAE